MIINLIGLEFGGAYAARTQLIAKLHLQIRKLFTALCYLQQSRGKSENDSNWM